MPTRRTTKDEFELFRQTFLEAKEIMGLKAWDTIILHEQPDDNASADIEPTVTDMQAVIKFAVDITRNFEPRVNPVDFANHEAGHLLMARMQSYAEDGDAELSDVVEEGEGLANVIGQMLTEIQQLRRQVRSLGAKAKNE